MPTPRPRAADVVALVLPDAGDAGATERLWRPVAESWPAFSPLPNALPVSAADVCRLERDSLGSAVLVPMSVHRSAGDQFKMLDHLWERGLPAVVVSPGDGPIPPRMETRGIIPLPADAPPAVVAATLNALLDRQLAFDSLRSELVTARRFHGGLRGEMDKLHDELQLAASVQLEFLPKRLPSVAGAGFHVFFRPASYVSGDIYNVQRLDEHRVGFFIADAVGHGVPAALMTMVIARGMTMKSIEGNDYTIHEPAEALAALNRELCVRHADTPRFATAVCGIIDTRCRTVTVAGAGHPPPLVIGPGGVLTPIETEGSLLGVFADAAFTQATVTLEPDEALVMYSDGFETAFPNPAADLYARRLPTTNYIERFAEIAEVWREDGLALAARRLAEVVDVQSGSLHQTDDLTALIVVPSVDAPAARAAPPTTAAA